MAYLNRTEHMGGLTREPELRFLPSGAAVCEFSLAISTVRWDPETRQDRIATLFLAVQAWGSLAEQVAEMGLQRGDTVHVLGELSQQEYEKKDGSKEKKTRIEAAIVTPVKQKAASARPATGGDWQREHGPGTPRAPWEQEEPPGYNDPPF